MPVGVDFQARRDGLEGGDPGGVEFVPVAQGERSRRIAEFRQDGLEGVLPS